MSRSQCRPCGSAALRQAKKCVRKMRSQNRLTGVWSVSDHLFLAHITFSFNGLGLLKTRPPPGGVPPGGILCTVFGAKCLSRSTKKYRYFWTSGNIFLANGMDGV